MTTLINGASTKFKFIKKVDGEVRVYQGKTVRTGDIVEFSGDFAVKAALNPDFEIYKEFKRGPGRPPKIENS